MCLWRDTFLEFLERLRMRSVEHISAALDLLSVVNLHIGLALWRNLYISNCGGGWDYCLSFARSFPHRVPCRGTYLQGHIILPCGQKFLGNTPVGFLVCSTFLRLINQSVLQIRVNWTALCFHFRRRILAFHIHTPTLWRTNNRVWGSLPIAVSNFVAWFVNQAGVVGVWIDAFACDEALAFCWCEFCVPDNCFSVTPFLLTILSHIVKIVPFTEGSVLLIHSHHLFEWRRTVLHQRRPRNMLPPPWVLFGCLPGLCGVSSQWQWFRVWRQNKISCCVDWDRNVCYFEIEM